MELSELVRKRQEQWRGVIASLKEGGTILHGSVPDRLVGIRHGTAGMSPSELLNDINRGLTYVLYLVVGSERTKPSSADWNTEVERFFDNLEQLDAAIAGVPGSDAERLMNGSHEIVTHLSDVAMFLRQIERTQASAGSPAAEIDDSDDE